MSLCRDETDGFLGMPQARGTGWGDPERDGAGADQDDGNGCVKGNLGGRQTSPSLCFELQVCSGFSVHLGKRLSSEGFRGSLWSHAVPLHLFLGPDVLSL